MNTLVIDTSTKNELIAVSTPGGEVSFAQSVNKSHSVTLFNNIDGLLDKSGIKINEINLIGVGIGPGSFTGIRIAISTARMLAQILKVPLVGVKSHRIYAVSIDAEIDDNILIAFDAKKNRVFGALYKGTSNALNPTEIIQPGDYTIDYILKEMDGNKTISTGDGILKFHDIISQKIKNHEIIKNFNLSSGKTSALINEIYNGDPGSFDEYKNTLPFYARKSDAEILKKINKK
ncbi:tRNA (adenosine(37)-N6)-threonylcarbamoyltransferase complex dimerization subunit type 1 TsaB [Spirochaetota bacterium]